MATAYDHYLNDQLESDDFRREYELARAQIDAVDELVNRIDDARVDLGMSKADLARAMRVQPAVVRRLLTAHSPNPTIGTIAKAAHAVGLAITVSPATTDPHRTDTLPTPRGIPRPRSVPA